VKLFSKASALFCVPMSNAENFEFSILINIYCCPSCVCVCVTERETEKREREREREREKENLNT
jgi:hypothetical protein